MSYQWLKDIRSFLYPPTCLLCESRGYNDLDLCRACADALPRLEHTCTCCARPLQSADVALCGACQRRPPAYDTATAFCRYQPPVDHLIHQLKFQGKLAHARLLGGLLAEHLAARLAAMPECVVPVPLHPRRVRSRGFNQALELARHIGRRLEVPVNHGCVRRTRNTDPQMELPAAARRKNVRRAFAVAKGLAAGHVAIVDDVVTTGSTVNELARVLRRAGVQRIDVWSIARVC
jgi:ComF family protein